MAAARRAVVSWSTAASDWLLGIPIEVCNACLHDAMGSLGEVGLCDTLFEASLYKLPCTLRLKCAFVHACCRWYFAVQPWPATQPPPG